MTDNQRKLGAMMKLAAARQATLTELSQQVYLEDLQDVAVEFVEAACHTLAREPRREYQTAFPALGDVLEACRQAKVEQAHEARRLLAAKCTTPEYPPPSPPLTRAEAKAFVARLKADVDRLRKAKR